MRVKLSCWILRLTNYFYLITLIYFCYWHFWFHTPVFEALYFLKLCPSISLIRSVKTLMSIFNNCQSYPKLNLKFKSLMYSIILRYSTWHWNRWGIFWLDQYPVGLFSYWLHSSATLSYRGAEIGKPRYRTCRLDPDMRR